MLLLQIFLRNIIFKFRDNKIYLAHNRKMNWFSGLFFALNAVENSETFLFYHAICKFASKRSSLNIYPERLSSRKCFEKMLLFIPEKLSSYRGFRSSLFIIGCIILLRVQGRTSYPIKTWRSIFYGQNTPTLFAHYTE